ncbi:hypothetical protein V9T40_010478 [Parthenolecanium corni]|uniref:Uncharacterized protein n=1 Tax=Parthenolecanium corni TaxID=536013 RepID=A0AAN9Y026_9HEMI
MSDLQIRYMTPHLLIAVIADRFAGFIVVIVTYRTV